MMHGSLYLFSNYMGYHSTLPFGYTKNRIIPFKVRKRLQCLNAAVVDLLLPDQGSVAC